MARVAFVVCCKAPGTLAVVAWLAASPGHAWPGGFPITAPAYPEVVATLTLDAHSCIHIGEDASWHLPEGSRIRFRFGMPGGRDNRRITILPEDVEIPPVEDPRTGDLVAYRLARPALGGIHVLDGELLIGVHAHLQAGDPGAEIPTWASADYEIVFSTETRSITGSHTRNPRSRVSATASGARARYDDLFVELGGATFERSPRSGRVRPVRIRLSGRFDRLPALR